MIKQIDHLVLTVKDIEKTINFYTIILGMKEETFGLGRKALLFGNQKINLHEAGNEFEPKAKHPLPGSVDLCFISNESLEKVVNILRKNNVTIEEGPVNRRGALGPIKSVYVRDPDQNLIEISHYLETEIE
ncbi:VOC family protein [Priestia megaterium]|uniref:VOC family protein n=1 Tax=Priestia megaterium TaxID=1404 RepID=UPI000D51B21B|nr:VOC family protein [Priestia megaterium]PVE64479.1 VOC family virulence protein [Priestia megaterium]PVE79855.1 VOC family virulence protein [Priestia megaterium]PVE83762.1 VOC family virulence protein [Priestia megaterium]PVE99560.1 VOC family virulence protein [Priestia megaterium]